MLRDERTIRAIVRAGVALSAMLRAPVAIGDPAPVIVETVDSGVIHGALASFSLDGGLVLQAVARQPRDSARTEVSATGDVMSDEAYRSDGSGVGRGPETPDSPVENRCHTVRAIQLPTADVIRIITSAELEDRSISAHRVTLAGPAPRDRLMGSPGAFADDRISLEVPSLGTVSIPLERVTEWRAPHVGDGDAEAGGPFDADFEGNDRLRLANGDVQSGVVLAIDSGGFVLDTTGGAIRLAHDQVAAARIIAVWPQVPAGVRGRVTLRDGSCVTATAVDWSGDSVALTVLDGVVLHAVADEVMSVEIVGGRWQPLGELTPISVEQMPMICVDWPYRIDRNVAGGPLMVAGEIFRNGIGVHARSVLTFDLADEYRQFVTSYGLDDDSGPLADVNVRILVDGVLRHEQAGVRRGTPIGPIRLDVAGADRIELIADFGRLGGIQDRFDWLAPGLVR